MVERLALCTGHSAPDFVSMSSHISKVRVNTFDASTNSNLLLKTFYYL